MVKRILTVDMNQNNSGDSEGQKSGGAARHGVAELDITGTEQQQYSGTQLGSHVNFWDLSYHHCL